MTGFEAAERGDLRRIFRLITLRSLESCELDWLLDWVNGKLKTDVPQIYVIQWLKEHPIREHISLAEKLQLEALDGRKIHYDPF